MDKQTSHEPIDASRGFIGNRRMCVLNRGLAPAAHFRGGSRRGGRGFTLTELLVVIAIIAVLAALGTYAAVNALKKAKQARIAMECNQLSQSVEDFKADYGVYPPNGVNYYPSPSSNTIGKIVETDFIRAFKKAFPSHKEPQALILGLCGQNLSGTTHTNLTGGMSPAEAVYFWLGGFSDDPEYPISGKGGPSFVDASPSGQVALGAPNPEVMENRTRRYGFDLTRLTPQNESGLDPSAVRYIEYVVNVNGTNQNRQINLWQYNAAGSKQPFIYFDVSRHKPTKYVPLYVHTDPGSSTTTWVYPLMQLRQGVTNAATTGDADLVYSNQPKTQILHCGLDDIWASTYGQTPSGQPLQSLRNSYIAANWLLFPTGPFTGDIADTLSNFTAGTLADEQKE